MQIFLAVPALSVLTFPQNQRPFSVKDWYRLSPEVGYQKKTKVEK